MADRYVEGSLLILTILGTSYTAGRMIEHCIVNQDMASGLAGAILGLMNAGCLWNLYIDASQNIKPFSSPK